MNQYRSKEREEEQYKEDIRDTEREDLEGGHCSFCGAEMEEDDNFCPDCGGPRAGIICEQCGTLNHGSFCSNCNSPLDDLAKEAVRKAKEDPHFQEAERLAAELLELEELISELKAQGGNSGGDESSSPGLDTSPAITEEMRSALDKYKKLFAGVAEIKVKEPEKKLNPSPSTPAPGSKTRKFSVSRVSLKEAVEKYKTVASKLQAQLDAMLPPAGATPQEQRNFFSARKITSSKVTTGDKFWVCNYCGCKHSQPSECYKPWMGGKWIVDMEVVGMKDTTLYD